MSQKNGIQTRPERGISMPKVAVETREEKRPAEPHERCPICYGGRGGIGVSNGLYKKASTLHQRFYKCDRCAHTWSIYLKPAEVVGINANLPEH